MNTINPISNPDDIRKEAEDSKPQERQAVEQVKNDEQAFVADPIALAEATPQMNQPQQVPDDVPGGVAEPLPQTIDQQPTAPNPVQASELSSIYPGSAQTTRPPLFDAPTNINYGFEYRLPLGSYILSLSSALTFYTLVVIPIISILTLMSAFGASASLTASSAEGLFSLETLKTYGPLWSFLFLSIFLIISKPWARWAAMGVAAGILLYGIYQLVSINDQSGGAAFQAAQEVSPQMYVLLFFGALPYIIAPLATIPYLMTSKARRAYS